MPPPVPTVAGRVVSLFDAVPELPPPAAEPPVRTPRDPPAHAVAPAFASGVKAKAHDLLAAIRTLQTIEHEGRQATAHEQATLAKFPGFGPLALRLFPDPVTGQYKDASWKTLGEELQSLLTPEEYASAKRTTFNAFYTSPVVIQAIHDALPRLGVPADAHVAEPGCGTGNFLAMAPATMQFTGIELDSISGRIAKARHAQHDIRIEDFRDTKLPQDLDAVIGNVPFADVRYDYHGQKLALHDYFLTKSLDALAPGGILAVVTSHKATGWMLREVGDRDDAALEAFLDEHGSAMPRTMLRYAIEKLSPEKRLAYLGTDRPPQSKRRGA
jgi:SAM-dependent methyltransferase